MTSPSRIASVQADAVLAHDPAAVRRLSDTDTGGAWRDDLELSVPIPPE